MEFRRSGLLESLEPCLDILKQYQAIWFVRQPGTTSMDLHVAFAMLHGLRSTINARSICIEKLNPHLLSAVRGRTWTQVHILLFLHLSHSHSPPTIASI
jgi:hypothetical protein